MKSMAGALSPILQHTGELPVSIKKGGDSNHFTGIIFVSFILSKLHFVSYVNAKDVILLNSYGFEHWHLW